MFPIFHDITTRIAKMYYDTSNDEFKSNAMDILQFINSSEKYSRLLENVQHPANQNIYIESKKVKQVNDVGGGEESGAKSSQLQNKLIQLAFNVDMVEQKEREFEALVLWVTNIDQRINIIMQNVARINNDIYNPKSF